MTWVKFCGMTRRGDVESAVELGVDAVGFVVAPMSPRTIEPAAVAVLGEDIAATRFLVTVGLDSTALLEAARVARVDGVQPHGEHAATAAVAARDAGYRVLFPVPVGGRVDLGRVPPATTPILDMADHDRHGGTGRSFDWTLAEGLEIDFVLAGGLTPETVRSAMGRLHPWGVDVSSGIEQAPGIKDHDLMRAFVEAMR